MDIGSRIRDISKSFCKISEVGVQPAGSLSLPKRQSRAELHPIGKLHMTGNPIDLEKLRFALQKK